MIVKYVRERGYKGKGKDPNLSLGKEYLVVGINFWSLNNYLAEASILSDSDQTPILVQLRFFDILDGNVPERWHLFDLSEAWCRLTAQEFGGDFWEEFHDGNPEAEAIFDDVMKRLHEFHGCAYIPPKRD